MNRSLIPRLAGLILIIALPTIVPCPVLAQSPALAVDKVAGLPGTNVDVGVNLATGASAVSSLQFDLTFTTSRISYVSATTGAAAGAAGKDAITGSTSSGARVVVFGLNQNALGAGPVAIVRLMIPAGSAAGTVTVGISSVAGSGPDGQAVSVTGTSGSVTVNMPADTAPPVISSVTAVEITQAAARVTWTTNEAADTQVEYGTTAAYGKTTSLSTSRVKTHWQSLSGLTPNTQYHYRVKSKDASGNLAVSGDFAFTTTAVDTAAPAISNVAAAGITQSAVTITWTTDEMADTQVEYGTAPTYGKATGLSTARVTAHSKAITGLTPNTLYHYRAKSKDAAGNLAVSGDFTFTTTAPDKTPPAISGIAVTGVTQSAATIIWTTDELSDTQVEYGTAATYGRSTTASTRVTAHAKTITGLTNNTLYHFRVKSKDAAGNVAVAGDRSFTTLAPDKTPPVITAVSVSGISTSTATVTWLTDEPADTQVQFGTATSYGKTTSLSTTKVTSHTQELTGLTAGKAYHYRVKSRDAAGNLAMSSDYTFTASENQTAEPLASLYVPSFPNHSTGAGQRGAAADEYTGFAIANLDVADAQFTFTAYDPDGNQLAGANVTNPARRTVKRGGQLPVIDSQLFGFDAGPIGWIKVESTVSKISSFFMTFDSKLALLDGASASSDLSTDFILPEAGEAGSNRIYLANPGSDAVGVRLDLMKSDGTVRDSVSSQIKADGALAADIYADLFGQDAADPSDYLRVTASRGVVPFEVLAEEGKDIRVLNGADATGGSSELYSPQYVVGGPWQSKISVVNLESRAARVLMHFVPDDPTMTEATQVFDIPANGKLYVSEQRLFLDPAIDPEQTITQGYVEIMSDGARLTGSVTFGNSGEQNFSSALPLVDDLRDSVVFSHVASNKTYFTGIALLNPGSTSAVATIDLYRSDGVREASVTATVPAGSRKCKLLTELFQSLVGKDRTSGYVRINSNAPLACFALFGTSDLSVLSAIPAQPAP